MSDHDDDLLLEPPDGQVAAVRDILFNDIIAAHRAADIYNRERSLAGWWVGGIGSGIGVLGMLALVVVVVTNQPQVRFTEIDDASGQIHESFGAKDAPAHFNDRVAAKADFEAALALNPSFDAAFADDARARVAAL